MSDHPSPPIAIITVTYRAGSFIDDFLQSVVRVLQERKNYSLILVDNASPDDTVAKIQDFVSNSTVAQRITLLKQLGNSGFGRGCNTGAEEAKRQGAAYYWFLNPDTQIDVTAADNLINCVLTIPGADFVGSALKNEHGVKRSAAFRFPTALTALLSSARLGLLDRIWHKHTSTVPLPDQAINVDWLTGASFMAKASSFEQSQGFDPVYFLYFEEVDLFLRTQRMGLKAWFCPSSVVYHQSGASTGINTRNRKELQPRPSYWFASRRYYYLKNYGRFYFLLTDFCFLLGHGIFRIKSWAKREPVQDPPQLIRSTLRYSALFKNPR